MAEQERKPGQEETEAIWLKCSTCQEILFRKEVERRLFICPKCGAHLRLTVEQRLLTIVDRGSFIEHEQRLHSNDPLTFTDRKPYVQRLADASSRSGREEAVVCGVATIEGRGVALGCFDFTFIGGSMGVVVGEKLTVIIGNVGTIEIELQQKLPYLSIKFKVFNLLVHATA